ncbi:MAG TPA: acyl carrier protein [Acidobacteriota bacterium]|nr:acyl carrier protein [Acidobacteriota bacterium]
MSTASEIRQFIADRFLFGDDTKLGDNDSLLEAGIIDSTGVLELIGHLEERYGIKVSDDELVPENLDTIAGIAAYLARKAA